MASGVAGESRAFELRHGRIAWLQVARGTAMLNDVELGQGDGAAIDDSELAAAGDAELLLFDMRA